MGEHGAPARVAAIIGTRPEAIKLAPVLRALRGRGFRTLLLCTGQHRRLDLCGCGLLDAPDEVLPFDPRGHDADGMCAALTPLAEIWLRRAKPDLVMVQGDTNSALAGTRAAKACGMPIAHVEAGLRTFDFTDPWPEERNRVEIDASADLLFAPTEKARRNLEAEQVSGLIVLSGNSGIDALLATAAAVPAPRRCSDENLILVTVHRRENRGAGVAAVGRALRSIASAQPIAFAIPLHVNPCARAEMIAAVKGLAAARLLEPQSYADMVALMIRSRLILSDSGGIQEEAPALGRPLLVLRESTERPEAITSGNAALVGTNPEQVAAEALRLLRDREAHARMSVPAFPFGAGGASRVIAQTIGDYLGQGAPESRSA